MMLPLLAFLLLLLLSPIVAHPSHNSTLSDERALLAFKNTLALDPYNSLHGWTPGRSFCLWRGVICSSRRVRVVSLDLSDMALSGPVSPFLGNLSFLRALNFSNNSFQGGVPYQLGRLSRLRILSLSTNKLQGPIPSTLGHCRSLQQLSLSHNQLSGSIPSELGLLRDLEVLWLADNQLTGSIPEFTSLTLTELGLVENRLKGSISSQLALLPTTLELLYLSRNQFTGEIPFSIGNMSSLIILDLSENKLHGSIPLEVGMLAQIIGLDLSENNLTGDVLIALSNCSNLQILDLGGNRLTGHIPWEFGTKQSQLNELYLWGNQLTGEIPSTLTNCTQLQVLELGENQLSGTIPVELGKLFRLTWLNFRRNHLVSGSNTTLRVFTALANCSHLQAIDFSHNYVRGILPSSIQMLSPELSAMRLGSNEFEGQVPNEIGNLTNLTELDISWNGFHGTIPSTLNKLIKLEVLDVSNNNLHGRIPSDLAHLKRLGALDLSNNMFSGQIPDSIGQLPQLRDLFLHYNQLSGQIPASLGRCITLETIDLSFNKFTGSIPPKVASLSNLEFFFNLSNNLLQGSLPLEISKMVMVQAIDLSCNHLSGGIPGVLASCTALQYLNLSRNALEGPIPISLAKLRNLEDMDLSSNKLNGTIPMNLGELKTLQHLNLSSNKLTGEVPKHGIFAMLDASAVMKNPGLCGAWIGLPQCSHLKNNQHRLLKKVVIPVVTATVVLVICFLFLQLLRRRKCMSPDPHAFGPTMISYKELVDATMGFNETNLIGIGGFGAVYKGILKNGTSIAVKVLNLQDESAHQSFSKECDALKRVRHRNVIRIITTCSNHDFKALVFPFMSNGSLETWLYPDREDRCEINLNERLRIAMEIAQGMEYLHHHCFVQVVHHDLKPSNVLLGDDMTAYLADFGISKLVYGNSMDSLSSTNALKGSIGYMAPEYGAGGKASTNGDVYSYGILLLELLTRKRPTDSIFVEGINLPKWVSMNFPNKITEVVDSNLLRDVNESEASRVLVCLTQLLQIGLVCASESFQERPSMMEIVKRLEKVKCTFLEIPRAFELPVDITALLNNKGGSKDTEVRSDQSWSTSS